MRIVHFIGGGDEGGAKSHVLTLVYELGRITPVSLISFRGGPFHDDAVKMGINAHVIAEGNPITDFNKAIRFVREGKYDLIHAHGAKGNIMGLLVSRKLHIPMITTIHSDYRLDYIHSLPKQLSYGLMNRLALRKIRNFVSVSESLRDVMISHGFNPQTIHGIHNGIDFDSPVTPCSRKEFYEKYHVPFDEDAILIGIMARLHPVKDHETFLRAAAKVALNSDKARFLISGPGELLAHLQQVAANLGIADKVCFTGMVHNPYDFFQVIDINVLTSISEGFPYVILEGARFSCATVSSLVGGLGQLFEQGVNGFTFPPGDDQQLAQYLTAFCLDTNLRESLGRALHIKSKSRFSLKAMRDRQLAIYHAVLERENNCRRDGKEYDMAILGYYGYRNSGDEAILEALVETIRQMKPQTNFIVLTKNPKETRLRHQVASCHRFNICRLFNILKHSRLFLAGGGSLIQDNTSTRSILYYLTMLRLARMCGARTMLFANGLGPISHAANRKRTLKVLGTLDAITLRDSDSMEEARQIGIQNAHITITADPALLLDASSDAETLSLMAKHGVPQNKELIGFSIRKWANTAAFIPAIAQLADHAASEYGLYPVFLPMQEPGDSVVSKQIIAHMKHSATLLEQIKNPSLMMGIVGKCNFLVGMRLHSLIYAANRGVPMGGLIYEPKVASFLRDVGQPVLGNIGLSTQEEMIVAFDAAYQQRDIYAQVLHDNKIRLQTAARENMQVALQLLEEQR